MDPQQLAATLGRYPPFDGLDQPTRLRLATASQVDTYEPGELILDAFADPSTEVFVVLEGEVNLWDSRVPTPDPDDRLGPGEVFGFSAMLSERSLGPRVAAATTASVARIPGEAGAAAFASPKGARFLAADYARVEERRKRNLPTYSTVEELIVEAPLVVGASASVGSVARSMTEHNSSYAVVRVPAHGYRLVTDTSLREAVLATGRSGDTPITDALADAAPTLPEGSSPSQAMIAMLEHQAGHVLVTDHDGGLRGVISMRDITIAPTTADVAMHQQLHRATSIEELVRRARAVPDLLDDLLRHGLASDRVIAVYSTLIDGVMRRAIELVMEARPELEPGFFTWMSLGSNGRREAVLSSDVDSAVVFAEGLTSQVETAYRAAFRDVEDALSRAGLTSDRQGVTAWRPPFSRTDQQWRAAAREWVKAPEKDDGAIMASLLADGRPIYGDPSRPTAATVFTELRRYPGSMRLMLQESLSHRAKLRSTRDALMRRSAPFDIKSHGLLPVVNIARWAALSVGSRASSTTQRLRDSAGSTMLPEAQASTLIEVFELLQRIRLRYQLMQHAHGGRVSDKLPVADMSPLDRSAVSQAVHEINALQRRMANVSAYLSPEQWTGPATP